MNGQTGNKGHRLFKIDQYRIKLALLVLKMHPPGNGQVTIKPGVQQGTTVNFNAQLQVILFAHLRLGFDLQTGAVSVGASNIDTVASEVFAAGLKSNDGGIIAAHIVTALLLQLPAVRFIQALETRSLKSRCHGGHCMERAG